MRPTASKEELTCDERETRKSIRIIFSSILDFSDFSEVWSVGLFTVTESVQRTEEDLDTT